MAVIQISKIQQRRGKEQETGIPQLSSAELAWAVDTQKLYIGNGAVAEGAPYVGNTRILTEVDNLFELASDYQYKKDDGNIQTGLVANYPTLLTLQEKLDEIVTSLEYGIVPDGSDQADKLQNAIDNLFLNPSTKYTTESRVTLNILPGTYEISKTIYIPSYCSIVGAGTDKTVFNFTGQSTPAFRFINDSSTSTVRSVLGSTTHTNQPKNCLMSGFTLNVEGSAATGFKLDAVRDSIFQNIKITGIYEEPGSNDSVAFDMYALSSIVTTESNLFQNITIDSMKYGVFSKYDIRNNSFNKCEFNNMFHGINFGFGADLASSGEEHGPRENQISNCRFVNIDRYGIIITNGHSNSSSSNNFENVGNEGGGNTNNQTSIIYFISHGNTSNQDTFDRRTMPYDTANDLSATFIEAYVAEIQGKVYVNMEKTSQVVLTTQAIPVQLFRLPVDSDAGIEVFYILRSTVYNQVRKGKFNIAVDYLNTDLMNQHVALVDEYEYIGENYDDHNIQFTATIIGGHVEIKYVNYNTADNTTLDYSYRFIN